MIQTHPIQTQGEGTLSIMIRKRDNRQAVKALRLVLGFGLDEVEVLVKVVELVMVKGRNRVSLHASPNNQCRETTKTDLLGSKKR